MAQKNIFRSIIVTATTFVGGMAVGMLLAPDSGSKSRAWLTDQATELSDWMERQGKFASRQTNLKVGKLRKNMGRGVKRNFPNLYEA
ncbi:MAG TPA: YtxH domain-containing protein, partial [Balneolaceae bacterium]|nr:YtxH domain-containing protein [Balneolaceae bacterium]